MKILITGGAGFVGSSLAKSLLNDGHDLYLIDNLSTGSSTNIDEIVDEITFIECDLSDPESDKIVNQVLWDVDLVYHFAASIGVKLIQEHPKSTLHNNVEINNRLFQLFENHQVKVIFSSTSEVYGETKSVDGSKETDKLEILPPQKSRGGYACSKLFSEFLIKSYTFPNTIVRLFNIVGSSQVPDYGHVLPRFIENINKNEDVVVYGNGEQVRSFCDIRDAVEMLKILIDDVHNGEIYNIGNDDNRCTINELASMCFNVFGSDVGRTHVTFDSQFGEIYIRFPNTNKIKQYYTCKYSLEDIVVSLL